MSVNKYICDGTVITEDSMTETITMPPGAGNPPYDPEGTEIDYSKGTDELEDAVVEAAMELEGDERAVAVCRALYDLNEMEGGFCCATLSLEYGDYGTYYEELMTTATSVTLQDTDPIVIEQEYDGETMTITVDWGAEVFGQAKGLATSAMAAAAIIMANY